MERDISLPRSWSLGITPSKTASVIYPSEYRCNNSFLQSADLHNFLSRRAAANCESCPFAPLPPFFEWRTNNYSVFFRLNLLILEVYPPGIYIRSSISFPASTSIGERRNPSRHRRLMPAGEGAAGQVSYIRNIFSGSFMRRKYFLTMRAPASLCREKSSRFLHLKAFGLRCDVVQAEAPCGAKDYRGSPLFYRRPAA